MWASPTHELRAALGGNSLTNCVSSVRLLSTSRRICAICASARCLCSIVHWGSHQHEVQPSNLHLPRADAVGHGIEHGPGTLPDEDILALGPPPLAVDDQWGRPVNEVFHSCPPAPTLND